MIGIAAPEISSLRVELNEGEAIQVPVDAASHVFALFHRGPLSIDKVVPDAGASASIECEPQEDDGYGISFLKLLRLRWSLITASDRQPAPCAPAPATEGHRAAEWARPRQYVKTRDLVPPSGAVRH